MRTKNYGKLTFKVTEFVKKIYDDDGNVIGEEVDTYVSCHIHQLHRLMAKMVGWTKANVSTKLQHSVIPGTTFMPFYNCRKEVFDEMYQIIARVNSQYSTQKKRMEKANLALTEFQARRVKKYGVLGE